MIGCGKISMSLTHIITLGLILPCNLFDRSASVGGLNDSLPASNTVSDGEPDARVPCARGGRGRSVSRVSMSCKDSGSVYFVALAWASTPVDTAALRE